MIDVRDLRRLYRLRPGEQYRENLAYVVRSMLVCSDFAWAEKCRATWTRARRLYHRRRSW